MLMWLGDSETREAVSTAERRCPRTQRLMRHLWRPILVTAEESVEAGPRGYRSWSQSVSPVEYERIRQTIH